jgi:hypothetical protein
MELSSRGCFQTESNLETPTQQYLRRNLNVTTVQELTITRYDLHEPHHSSPSTCTYDHLTTCSLHVTEASHDQLVQDWPDLGLGTDSLCFVQIRYAQDAAWLNG